MKPSRLQRRSASGFSQAKRSHHIFVHPHIRELVNFQEVDGKAKPYRVRHLLKIVERYALELTTGEEP